MAKGRGGAGRGEPNFDVPEGRVGDPADLDLRLSRADRAGGGVARGESGSKGGRGAKGRASAAPPARALAMASSRPAALLAPALRAHGIVLPDSEAEWTPALRLARIRVGSEERRFSDHP